MTASPLVGRALAQVMTSVSDLPRAIGFYRDVLGLPFLFETNGMVFFQLAGARLMIGSHPDHPPAPGGSCLYFDAPDLPELAAALEARGVSFSGPAVVLQSDRTGDLMLRSFADPDGNLLALLGLVARQQTSDQ